MKNLVEILEKETESLKIQFVEMNINYAKKQFKTFSESEYLHSILKTTGKLVYYRKQSGKTRAEDSRLSKMISILNQGEENYINKVEKESITHYENSILKLARRIQLKGLNESNLKIVTSHIDVNIETTLTDGEKKVRAFTIIAGGNVQRPHYRYLIK